MATQHENTREERIQEIMQMNPTYSRAQAEELLGDLRAWLDRFLDDYFANPEAYAKK